ncbi:nitroreductase family protein [Streptomyces sioyaensis]|uniref:nitroreductase family protein n=1 Tax=Streptomyces sioyaensis TaxID=67364 RepID=UPI0036F132FA
MDAIACITGRRSSLRLAEPGPHADDLAVLMSCAQAAPDHGRLQPWRLDPVTGHRRRRIGDALARAALDQQPDMEPVAVDRMRAKPLRAPLLISVISRAVRHPRIPEWEQLASAACAVQNVTLAAHALGYGAIWRTGPYLQHPKLREAADLETHETLRGWVYVGSADM